VLIALLVCAPSGSRAQQPATEKVSEAEQEQARKAYQDGDSMYKTGHYEEAARDFEFAYRIIKFPTILFDIAQTYRRWYEKEKDIEKLRRAVETYKNFLRDSQPGARQRPIAEKLIPELEKTIAAETRRRREELIAKATGKNGVFLADQLMAENSLKDAALVLDRVLGSRDNPREVMVGAFQKRGLVGGGLAQQGVKGEQETAVEAFKRALVLDPGFVLPEGVEKATTQAFEAAQKALAGTRPLAMTHVPPGDVPKNKAVRIRFGVESDPLEQVEEVAVLYRRSGGGAFFSVRAQRKAGAVEIPATFLTGMRGGTKIDYYVAGLDGAANELVTLGSAKEPFVIAVATDPSEVLVVHDNGPPAKPTYKKWWVWTVVAVAAAAGAGAGVGLYYGLRPNVNNPPAVSFPTP
jgi:tetratricopeptide (TPR) repeat protein